MVNIKQDIKFEIMCRQYLVKRLGVLKRDIENTVVKEKERQQSRIEILCGFANEIEAQDAYGYGDITAEEYEAVIDFLRQGSTFEESKTPKSAALEILNDFMSRQKQEIRDFEWELKSPEEQERINKSNEEFKKRRSHGI